MSAIAEQMKASRAAAREGWTHYLYRCYDADGQLLYIGCTHDVGSRMDIHRASWDNFASAYLNMHMVRYEVEEAGGFTAARKAEREAIGREAPLLNVHHNRGRHRPRVWADPTQPREMSDVGRQLAEILGRMGKPADTG